MGSHSSSRAGGGGARPPPRGPDPEEEEEEEEEEENQSYFLRRGQIPGGLRDPPESDEEVWDGGGGETDPPPPAPPPPDTRVLASHELRAQLELAAGRGGGRRPGPPEENLPRLLRQREWGRCHHGSFSPGEKSRLSSHFLPNHVAFADSYPQKAFCGLFSDDGSLFVSACQDQTLRVYECRGEGLRLFRASRGRDVGWSILDVVFTPDASQCLYSSWSDYGEGGRGLGEKGRGLTKPLPPPAQSTSTTSTGTATTTRPLTYDQKERRFAVFSLAVGPDGREVVGGANDGCLYVYDREVQRRVLRVEAHEDDVNAVALGDTGEQLLLSGGRRRLPGLGPPGDGRYLVSNSKDQTAKLWDLRRPAGPGGLAAARRAVARQSWDYRWQRAPRRAMATAPLPGDSSLMTYRGHAVLHTLLRCRLSPPRGGGGGLYLGTGCASGAVLVYDVLTGRAVRRLTNHGACVRDVCWHPHEGTLASASWDGSIRLWDYREPQDEDASGGGATRVGGGGDGDTPVPHTSPPKPELWGGSSTRIGGGKGRGKDLSRSSGAVENLNGWDGAMRNVNGWDGAVRNLSGWDGAMRNLSGWDGAVKNLSGWDGALKDIKGWDGRVKKLNGWDGALKDIKGWDGRVKKLNGRDGDVKDPDTQVGRAVKDLNGLDGTVKNLNG
ncbi:DDB1- and CUL4-associated factor 11 [Grus japonensis]|uniref:DDB1- and CUL4-associated factor 11 n=1 Tax=Grus japonensis TaxID=30415 RepID=A0ABC9Y897_GRUJA